jgi:hypothetical protein
MNSIDNGLEFVARSSRERRGTYMERILEIYKQYQELSDSDKHIHMKKY